MSVTANAARAILERSLQPSEDMIVNQVKLAEKKIKLAAKFKCDHVRFEVFVEMMTVNQVSAIAMLVALRLTKNGFKVKIRKNELYISWKNVD